MRPKCSEAERDHGVSLFLYRCAVEVAMMVSVMVVRTIGVAIVADDGGGRSDLGSNGLMAWSREDGVGWGEHDCLFCKHVHMCAHRILEGVSR